MTAPVVRRLHLAAVLGSPALARAAVEDAVRSAGLADLRDEALLLTTELVTNGVIHAGTDLELEIVADLDSISVMVLDGRCGPLSLTGWDATTPGPDPESKERGRGLLLVDRLADRWGTVHHAKGKGVWFRLERDAPIPQPPPDPAAEPGLWLNVAPGAFPRTSDRLNLIAENRHLRQVDTERRSWLTFLAEAGELLAQSLDIELTLALIPRLLVPRLGAWCAVHTLSPGRELRLAAVAHTDEEQESRLARMLAEAAGRMQEILRGPGPVALPSPVDGVVVPLVARGQRLGLLTVGRSGSTWPNGEDLEVVQDIARRSALAIDNARIHADRLTVAQELQRGLLPPRLPKIPGMELGAEYVPSGAGAEVGGDFYDVMALSDREWLIVVGDVSGKGIRVATLTGLVREVTRTLIRDGRSVPETLTRLNQTLVERGEGRFCTMAVAVVSRTDEDEDLDVRLYLAGHEQPILVAVDGCTALVGSYGSALGLLDKVSAQPASFRMRPGEALILYTDGVTERRRGEELYGLDRLRWAAAGLAGYPAEAVAARLRSAAIGFSAEVPKDDLAIFVLRNDGPP